MDWLDLFAVQGALKSLLQHHSSKASILQCSAFFTVQLSHPYMTTGKTIVLEKILMMGKTEGKRRRGWQRMRWLDGITDSMDVGLTGKSHGWKSLVGCSLWGRSELERSCCVSYKGKDGRPLGRPNFCSLSMGQAHLSGRERVIFCLQIDSFFFKFKYIKNFFTILY